MPIDYSPQATSQLCQWHDKHAKHSIGWVFISRVTSTNWVVNHGSDGSNVVHFGHHVYNKSKHPHLQVLLHRQLLLRNCNLGAADQAIT